MGATLKPTDRDDFPTSKVSLPDLALNTPLMDSPLFNVTFAGNGFKDRTQNAATLQLVRLVDAALASYQAARQELQGFVADLQNRPLSSLRLSAHLEHCITDLYRANRYASYLKQVRPRCEPSRRQTRTEF